MKKISVLLIMILTISLTSNVNAFQCDSAIFGGGAEVIVSITNSPSTITHYKVRKADGSWVTRTTANLVNYGTIKIRIDLDGYPVSNDSSLLRLEQNTTTRIVYGDYLFDFTVGQIIIS